MKIYVKMFQYMKKPITTYKLFGKLYWRLFLENIILTWDKKVNFTKWHFEIDPLMLIEADFESMTKPVGDFHKKTCLLTD